MTTGNDLEWEALYQALVDQLGLSRETFQLLYPFTSWSWPVTAFGYTSSAAQDFCSTMPQWSATGAYASSGARFDGGYGMFLSILLAYSSDPALEAEVRRQQTVLQTAQNDYDTAYRQAAAAYEEATEGGNVPTFTDWLATTEGRPWSETLDAAWQRYQEEYDALVALLDQTQTPGLEQALEDYRDTSFYTRYQDPKLSSFPLVPAYSVTPTPQQWLAEIAAGRGTPATVEIVLPGTAPRPAAEGSYRDTWAGGSRPVPYPFLALDGTSIDTLSATETRILLHLEAWTTVPIVPAGWYDAGFVAARAEGPFIRGYTGYEDPGSTDTYLWGEGGAFDLRKTALLAAYQPTFEVIGDEGTLARLSSAFSTAHEARIGPFRGLVEDGDVQLEPGRLSVRAASDEPMIFGVDVEVMPGGEIPASVG